MSPCVGAGSLYTHILVGVIYECSITWSYPSVILKNTPQVNQLFYKFCLYSRLLDENV